MEEFKSKKYLKISANARQLHTFLGSTRIILMNDEDDKEIDKDVSYKSLESLKQSQRQILFGLSVFRYGFNHKMVESMLQSEAFQAVRDQNQSTYALLQNVFTPLGIESQVFAHVTFRADEPLDAGVGGVSHAFHIL